MGSILHRGEGKNKGAIKKSAFYKFYLQNASSRIVEEKVYNAFTKDLLNSFSEAIVTEALELRIPKVGKLRIRTNKLKFFRKDGTRINKIRVDWKKTWDYWFNKYPGLTKEQIVELNNKIVIYHENEHTQQEFYEHHWDKLTSTLKFKTFYSFKASRQYSRLIAKVVKDPLRKVFYYG
jgi:hypothetical protein